MRHVGVDRFLKGGEKDAGAVGLVGQPCRQGNGFGAHAGVDVLCGAQCRGDDARIGQFESTVTQDPHGGGPDPGISMGEGTFQQGVVGSTVSGGHPQRFQ